MARFLIRLKLPGLLFDRSAASGCWIPFWDSNGPNLSKRGLAASILDFHDPTFHFLAEGPLFVLSAVWILQKGVPRKLTSDLPPFPAAWVLFCAVSGLDPPKRGPVTASNLCFRVHLFSSLATRRRCTCVSSLCSFFCLWPLLSVRAAVVVWRFLLFVPRSAEHTLYARVA